MRRTPPRILSSDHLPRSALNPNSPRMELHRRLPGLFGKANRSAARRTSSASEAEEKKASLPPQPYPVPPQPARVGAPRPAPVDTEPVERTAAPQGSPYSSYSPLSFSQEQRDRREAFFAARRHGDDRRRMVSRRETWHAAHAPQARHQRAFSEDGPSPEPERRARRHSYEERTHPRGEQKLLGSEPSYASLGSDVGRRRQRAEAGHGMPDERRGDEASDIASVAAPLEDPIPEAEVYTAGLRRRHVEQQNERLERARPLENGHADGRHHHHGHHEDSDEEEGNHPEKAAIRVVLESSTESEVESLVEIGAISCMSGRLPGVSIFYAFLLFTVVALASAVLMAAAHTSYEGVPCENHEECLRGSFCDVDEDLGTCRSCVQKRMNAFDFYILFDEIFHSDVVPRPEFANGTLLNDDKFEYLCPEELPNDIEECVARCENPDSRCISSQYLTYFSVEEPATIVVALFVIVFFAVLARQQQQQTLQSFFFMRHEIQYNPLRELSKRMKRTKRKYQKEHGKLAPSRIRLMTAKSAHGHIIPARANSLTEHKEAATEINGTDVETPVKDSESLISDDGILADLVDPVEDDDASFSSQGTVEAKYDEWKLRFSTYSTAVAQMVLQQVAVPLMRLALFIELVSLRTAVLVSTVTIMFTNATILDFLVNSLAVLFVLDLDEMLFVTVNQSFPDIVDSYIAEHQGAELEVHRKNRIREIRREAVDQGVPIGTLLPPLEELDKGHEPTMPTLALESWEADLLRAAGMVHVLSLIIYCLMALQAPDTRCFQDGQEFLRYVLGTGIAMLYGELIVFTVVHFAYSYYKSGASMTLLPFVLTVQVLIDIIQFLMVLTFQLQIFLVLQ